MPAASPTGENVLTIFFHSRLVLCYFCTSLFLLSQYVCLLARVSVFLWICLSFSRLFEHLHNLKTLYLFMSLPIQPTVRISCSHSIFIFENKSLSLSYSWGGGGGAVAQVEHATPGQEVPGSIPAVAARSLLVGSVSV